MVTCPKRASTQLQRRRVSQNNIDIVRQFQTTDNNYETFKKTMNGRNLSFRDKRRLSEFIQQVHPAPLRFLQYESGTFCDSRKPMTAEGGGRQKLRLVSTMNETLGETESQHLLKIKKLEKENERLRERLSHYLSKEQDLLCVGLGQS